MHCRNYYLRLRHYGMLQKPGRGPFWTNRPDPRAFDRISDYLFAIDHAQWRRDLEASKYSSLVTYDPGNSMLKAILENELGLAPVSPN